MKWFNWFKKNNNEITTCVNASDKAIEAHAKNFPKSTDLTNDADKIEFIWAHMECKVYCTRAGVKTK